MLQVWAALCVNVMLLMEGRARSSCGRATRMAHSVLLRTASATAETFRLHHQRRGKGAAPAPCASLPDSCLTQMASSVKTARICALLSMSRASIFSLGYFFLFMSLSSWVWLCHDERRGAFGDCQVLKSKAQFLKVAHSVAANNKGAKQGKRVTTRTHIFSTNHEYEKLVEAMSYWYVLT